MSEYDDSYDEFIKNHWALPLVDAPEALVSVIETKIARAELAERRRIIDLVEHWPVNDEQHIPRLCGGCSFIARIEEEN